jgi:hypothetical protein
MRTSSGASRHRYGLPVLLLVVATGRPRTSPTRWLGFSLLLSRYGHQHQPIRGRSDRRSRLPGRRTSPAPAASSPPASRPPRTRCTPPGPLARIWTSCTTWSGPEGTGPSRPCSTRPRPPSPARARSLENWRPSHDAGIELEHEVRGESWRASRDDGLGARRRGTGGDCQDRGCRSSSCRGGGHRGAARARPDGPRPRPRGHWHDLRLSPG